MSEILLKRIAELEYMNSELYKTIDAIRILHQNIVKTISYLQMFPIDRFEAR